MKVEAATNDKREDQMKRNKTKQNKKKQIKILD